MAPNRATTLLQRVFKSLGFWRFFAVVFALLNLKHIPFGWHLRILTGLLTHIPYLPFPLRRPNHTTNPPLNPNHLFSPLLIRSRAQLPECDYNVHKSNSTYLADFDIARMHLLTRLFPPGLLATAKNLYKEAGREGPRRLGIYLGGVSCAFRREIGVGVGFEMWTRVLCWDRKWLYVVTHFVERGAVRPRGFAFQPWKNKTDRAKEPTPIAEDKEKERGKEGKSSAKNPLFFAIAVAKYVCKRGRLTIPPELVLRNSGLLPPKPQEQPTPAAPQPEEKTTGSPEGEKDATTALPPIADLAPAPEPTPTAGHAGAQAGAGEEWTWHRIETERQRGMAIMEAWNRTEALDEAFGGSEAVALGEFWDFP